MNYLTPLTRRFPFFPHYPQLAVDNLAHLPPCKYAILETRPADMRQGTLTQLFNPLFPLPYYYDYK